MQWDSHFATVLVEVKQISTFSLTPLIKPPNR